jgi:hypothetical protein
LIVVDPHYINHDIALLIHFDRSEIDAIAGKLLHLVLDPVTVR